MSILFRGHAWFEQRSEIFGEKSTKSKKNWNWYFGTVKRVPGWQRKNGVNFINFTEWVFLPECRGSSSPSSRSFARGWPPPTSCTFRRPGIGCCRSSPSLSSCSFWCARTAAWRAARKCRTVRTRVGWPTWNFSHKSANYGSFNERSSVTCHSLWWCLEWLPC